MRGKASAQAAAFLAIWITPAYAGKRARHADRRTVYRDHPRVCGEKRSSRRLERRPLGSPPRMRGKVTEEQKRKYRIRITPAYAGKSFLDVNLKRDNADHPRVCGEKGCRDTATRKNRGSPPRVRGKDYNQPLTHKGQRITPACAGKRMRSGTDRTDTGDHPRVCGEKPGRARRGWRLRGSPPRVRGKATQCIDRGVTSRITPACAGKRS